VTAKRIFALLAAALLIVVGLIVRAAISDNSSSPSNANGAPAGFSLVCSNEFSEVCNALSASLGSKVTVSVAAAGDTLDSLAKADPKDLPDAWLTLEPFPAMLDQIRQRTYNLRPATASVDPVGAADPAMTLANDRAAALQKGCGSTAIAKCVAAAAGTPWSSVGGQTSWGNVKVSLPDPASEAAGLVALANVSAAYYGTADLASKDLAGDNDFAVWLGTFARHTVAPSTGDTPLGSMLLRPSLLNVAFTDTAEITQIPASRLADFTSLPAKPSVQLQAVFTLFAGARSGGAATIRQKIADALQKTAGWTAPTAAAAAPSADTFIALRAVWKE